VNSPIRNILAVTGRVRVRSGHLNMLDLLAGLGGHGYGASLVCTSMPPEIAERGLPFPVTTWSALGGRWTGFIRAGAFREFFRETEADVIHVHGAGLHFSGRQFVRTVRAPLVFTPYSLNDGGHEVAFIGRRAGRVIALSEFMREGLVNRSRIPRDMLRIVPPGVDLKLYDFLPPRIGERIPVVGAVAPLEPGRGLSVFLHAVKLLADSVREAEFIVAGDGREERSLRKEAAELGIEKRVTFVTRLADYRGAISALDIFVRPALAGGLGFGVLEAMAMGKAVVATSTGSVPEMVVEGETARLVAKGDAAALADAVGQLLTHPQVARDLGAAARLSVEKRFNMQRLVADTVAVYAEAIEEMKP
jgi:glycosyltransferase involved in cell wall biosynthesis